MKSKFKEVLQKDFSRASIEDVECAMLEALGPLPHINWLMDKNWAVIRARFIDETKEDITNPGTFGAPPPEYTSMGRANLVNHPVFYGSFDARTAMHEIKVNIDTECYVSLWEFKKDIPHVTTFLSSVDEKNDLSELQNKIPKRVPKGLKGGYTTSSFSLGLKLRANAFTQSHYEFTSKIAHGIIYHSSAKSQGLIYPSVIDPYRCNIALHPDYVTDNMECVRVYKMVWSGAFIFRVLARGSLKDDKIVWEETGAYEMDELDYKYSGSNGPNEIHPKALKVLNQK